MSNVPDIRFKGFTDAWEQRELFENIERIIDFRGKTPKKLGLNWSNQGYLALSALNVKNGYIDLSVEANYGDESLYSKWMGNNKLEKGQVLFTTEAPMGNIARVPDNKGYILSQRTISFVTKQSKLIDEFLYVLLGTQSVKTSLNSMSSGGTAKGISQRSLKNLYVTVPPSIEEQKKIGDTIILIEDTITLLQRKINNLNKVKKGLLQKLFPTEQSINPRIRFNGFNQDWEQRELGEVVQLINGKAFKQNELLDDGKYRVLRVGNFNTNNQWYYSNLELPKDKYIDKGDLVYLWATTFGPEFWNEEKVIYHYHIWKVNIIDKNLDKNYLYSWMKYDKNKILNNTNGSTMIHITKENMDSRKIKFPNIEEQIKIGQIFGEIDRTITLLQKEVEMNKQIKKGFLQKLFPKE